MYTGSGTAGGDLTARSSVGDTESLGVDSGQCALGDAIGSASVNCSFANQFGRISGLVAMDVYGSGGGSQPIWAMSKIWDRIKENRELLGVGDLGGFKEKRGILQPQPELVTI